MDFTYNAPKPTVRDRIQYLSVRVAEGLYAGQRTSACGDDLTDISDAIRRVAGSDERGYIKADVEIDFPGFYVETRYDITQDSTLTDLLDFIDAEARYYAGIKPDHMSQEVYDGWRHYMNKNKVAAYTAVLHV